MDVLGAGSFGYGLLITAWTLGMAAGAAGLAHRVPATGLAVAALLAIVAQGLGIVGAAVSPVLWTALIGFAVGGVAHGVKNVLLRTLIHEHVPEALRGRAFAAYDCSNAIENRVAGCLSGWGSSGGSSRRHRRSAPRGRRAERSAGAARR
jgi:MFS family permease